MEVYSILQKSSMVCVVVDVEVPWLDSDPSKSEQEKACVECAL